MILNKEGKRCYHQDIIWIWQDYDAAKCNLCGAYLDTREPGKSWYLKENEHV